jgi:hypothetical protein
MKINLDKIALILVGLFCCTSSFASNNPPPPIPPPPPGLPIDGGLLILAFFSLILAFCKIYKSKKASSLS